VSGAFSLLLSTTVHPAASAGANFIPNIIAGMFHGIIAATGPIGCRKVMFTNPGVLRLVVPLAS